MVSVQHVINFKIYNISNEIFVNTGASVAQASGGSAMANFGINLLVPSDWAFSDLIIWDSILSYQDMKTVSDKMIAFLKSSTCAANQYYNSGSCTACPGSSTSTSGSVYCSCVTNQYWDTTSNTCVGCPSGSSSSAGALVCSCSDSNYYVSGAACVPYFTSEVNGASPYGIWRVARAPEQEMAH